MSDAPTPTGYQRSPGGGFKWLPPSAEHLSKLLPQYEVECLLGRGGMGAVYKGRQKSLNRLVAIKILPPEVEDEDASYLERFKNEAQVMAKFIHPGIVAVHDFGETAEGQLYIVMEFVDGTDVAQMITAQGRLPPEHALAIAAHVCDALSYAHSHGVIHRDIKPANILINREGAVKVADFGLAKVDEPGTTGLTKTGMAMGTPDYVAPEALMFGTQVDARADLYAIGVMLYHMLTGEIPRGSFDLPSRRIGTDPRFDAIILKAMKMDREERYQSSGAMRHDLDVILNVPLAQAGGESSAAIPIEGSAADTPVRTSQSPPQRGANQAAGKSARAPLDPSASYSPNPKSKATMITLAATAAVLATGAFLVLKPDVARNSDFEKAPQTQNSVSENRAATAATAQSGPLNQSAAEMASQRLPEGRAERGNPLSGPAKDTKTTAQGIPSGASQVRTTLPAASPAKPVLVAQANTAPKLAPAESQGQNEFVGEWFGEDDPKGARVVIYADGRVELWRDGKQDQRPNGTFWWTGWKWRMNGADLEILNGDKNILYQTWKKSGADTVLASEKGTTVNKKRSKDFWSGVNGTPSTVTQVQATTPPAAAPPAVTLPPELTTLQQQYDKLLVERVTGIYDADVAKLNTGYLAGLDRAAATAQSAGELDTVLAIQEEKKLIAAKQPVPTTDDAKTPEALKGLRTIFRTSLAKLDEQRTANHTALLTPYATRLKQIEADLTKAGRIPDAVAVKTYREGLGTNPVPTVPAVATTTPDAGTPMKETPATNGKQPKTDSKAAAEWVLGLGEKVILFDGKRRVISKVEELPAGKLGNWGIVLDGKDGNLKAISDADMSRFAGQDELKEVVFRKAPLTEAGMRFIKTCPNLNEVVFEDMPLNEEWISHLKGLKKLTSLEIVGKVGYRGLGLEQLAGLSIENLRVFRSNFNDQGLAAIKDFKSVVAMNLEDTEVTDAGLAYLADFKKLKVLNAGVTQITAQGLERLKGIGLTEIGFGKTTEDLIADLPKAAKLFPDLNSFTLPRNLSYTAQEIALLGRSFPKLNNILTYSLGFGDDACAGLVEAPAMRNLSIINAGKITDAGLAPIARLKSLQSLTLHGCQMTDRGLELYQGTKSLKNLFIHSVPVTDAGLAAFKKARPDVMVEK
jgi:serine/threonine protein kinase